jgi:hypothetical protein
VIRRIVEATCAVVCAAALSGCIVVSGPAPVQEGANPAVSTTVVASQPVTHGVVQEKLSAGPWTVTVEEATRSSKSVGGKRPAQGSDFLLITVGFENKGTDALNVRPQDFELTDPNGKAMPQADSSLAAFNARSMRPLMPRFGTSTTFVYRVPQGSVRYRFVFSPPGQNTRLEWQVP